MQALCVGINYQGSNQALAGCINDAENFQQLLTKANYNPIEVLTDNSTILPTRADILRSLVDLVLSEANQLVFTYSGHGTRDRDTDGDEEDGFDECLVALDGIIRDDELRGVFQLLRPEQRLIVILDCCHSGTGLDLAYNLWSNPAATSYKMVRNRKQLETKGQVIMLSGCLDNQYSADTFMAGQYQGALSGTFNELYNKDLTYRQFVAKLRVQLKTNGYQQTPMLSSGQKLSLSEQMNWW